MRSRIVEIWVGVFIAAGLAALFMLAMQVSNLSEAGGDDGYEVTARFLDVSGLKVRSPVMIGGVRIGRVTEIRLNDNLDPEVVMTIESRFDELPLDTLASIYTFGLLGEKYVGMELGGDPDFLKDGDEMMLMGNSTVVLEKLIGQLLFSKATEGGAE